MLLLTHALAFALGFVLDRLGWVDKAWEYVSKLWNKGKAE